MTSSSRTLPWPREWASVGDWCTAWQGDQSADTTDFSQWCSVLQQSSEAQSLGVQRFLSLRSVGHALRADVSQPLLQPHALDLAATSRSSLSAQNCHGSLPC